MSRTKTKQRMKADEVQEKDVSVRRGGKQIVLPDAMSYDEGIEWLHRKKEEEETYVSIREKVQAFPLDGAVALAKVLQNRYGWANLVPRPGFFGPNPPTMIGVNIAHDKSIQVPWGDCQIPNIEGTISTSWTQDDGRPVFEIRAEVKRKHEKEIKDMADEVRQFVRKDSIYRGKGIKISFRDNDGERIDKFSPTHAPRFIDMSKIDPDELIYPQDTMEIVKTTLFNPVERTESCRHYGVPLKRGVLLEGPYGTGKTLCAYVLGYKCVQNDWTFLYLEDVRDLDMAMSFAKLYEPCVVFAEDVDRATAGGRTAGMDKILNTLDGVDSKKHEIMVVLTTNDKRAIHPAFVRPGRIDAVIPILPPDNEATVRLVRSYGCDAQGNSMIDATDEQLAASVEPLVGANAAFIREAVERAKLSAVAHCDPGANGNLKITAEDIAVAAKSMAAHLGLVNPNKEGLAVDPMSLVLGAAGEMLGDVVVRRLLSPKAIRKAIEPLMQCDHGDGL